MKKEIHLVRPFIRICASGAAAALCGALCACGHNGIVYDKGFGFRAGFDPEHLSADVRFVYGEALTLGARDNVEIELVSDADGGSGSAASDVKTGSKLKIRIGRQINGYTRDLIGTGATADQIRALLYPGIDTSE